MKPKRHRSHKPESSIWARVKVRRLFLDKSVDLLHKIVRGVRHSQKQDLEESEKVCLGFRLARFRNGPGQKQRRKFGWHGVEIAPKPLFQPSSHNPGITNLGVFVKPVLSIFDNN